MVKACPPPKPLNSSFCSSAAPLAAPVLLDWDDDGQVDSLIAHLTAPRPAHSDTNQTAGPSRVGPQSQSAAGNDDLRLDWSRHRDGARNALSSAVGLCPGWTLSALYSFALGSGK